MSRRSLLTAAPTLAAMPSFAESSAAAPVSDTVSLDGPWSFRLDGRDQWTGVAVPHTWQTDPNAADHYGVAWYKRDFDAPRGWESSVVRIEFEAVFHSATVWVNGAEAGSHLGKGYTAFALDITRLLKFGSRNEITVRVDNGFNDAMLPRGRSSDWAHDGGIYRPVRLLVTPPAYIETVAIDAIPDLPTNAADIRIVAAVRNGRPTQSRVGAVHYTIREELSGVIVATGEARSAASGKSVEVEMKVRLQNAKLWHFDNPFLYTVEMRLASSGHSVTTTFGIRSFIVKDGAFHLNGQPVKLMGVERMAGSNPEYGMAEPTSWIERDHADMKNLNCIFTRVHWPQDRRVLDYCDRHGILIQTEVPTWGGATFKGMTDEPSPEIMNNGLEQLREMVARDRNHPCIVAWGLCNEINGQNAPAYRFAERMLQEAKRLDPNRLCTYASNSLQTTPERDVSRLMDFISWNEYYESWYKGGPEKLERNLAEIAKAFPGKPIVVSEYGYCACTEDRPEDDARRSAILRTHDAIFRESPAVGGLIFFCYNDYRTHIGDKGVGPLKQRVHGVVDLYGNRKPSYEELRRESSPIELFEARSAAGGFAIDIRTRQTAPAYTLRGYRLRAVLYGAGDIPLEAQEAPIATLRPGQSATATIQFATGSPKWVRFEIVRPTGFSVATFVWRA
jgi:beta-glucuronidase